LIQSYTLEPDGTTINLLPQESISLKTLFYGLMLGSGNDAANAIAHYCSGDILKFMQGLNSYLKKLGCKDTNFNNPHGLHHIDHYTTAYDLALIARKAMTYPVFSQIVKTTTYLREETNKQKPFVITQTNRLIKPGPYFYPKALGIKTGYTSNAGFNLVAAASNGDRNLIAVLLGSKVSEARYLDAANLFETAFNEKKILQRLFARGTDVFKNQIKGAKQALRAALENDVDISYYPSEPCEVKTNLIWLNKKLPIYPGSTVGILEVSDRLSNRLLSRHELIAQNAVEYTWLARASEGVKDGSRIVMQHKLSVALVLSLFSTALLVARRSSRKKTK
jgi:serine-type D-Ala-D-Ala carboxypeptidase (penicillin-binding protein 5/6)